MKGKTLVTLLIVIGFLITSILILTQTSIIVKRAGDDFTRKISFENEDNGIILIQRDDRSLSVADWISFEEEKDYSFFTKDQKYVKKKIKISPPSFAERGWYYYKIKINNFEDEDVIINKRFFIF